MLVASAANIFDYRIVYNSKLKKNKRYAMHVANFKLTYFSNISYCGPLKQLKKQWSLTLWEALLRLK